MSVFCTSAEKHFSRTTAEMTNFLHSYACENEDEILHASRKTKGEKFFIFMQIPLLSEDWFAENLIINKKYKYYRKTGLLRQFKNWDFKSKSSIKGSTDKFTKCEKQVERKRDLNVIMCFETCHSRKRTKVDITRTSSLRKSVG